MLKHDFIQSDQPRRTQSAPCAGDGVPIGTTKICGVSRGEGEEGEEEVVEHSERVSRKKCNRDCLIINHSERSNFPIMKDSLAAKRNPAGTVTNAFGRWITSGFWVIGIPCLLPCV